MAAVLVVVGLLVVVVTIADLLNTLVTTSTSLSRAWPSMVVTRVAFWCTRTVASRLRDGSRLRERLLSVFAPVLLLTLLTMWAGAQVVGFSLVWYGLEGLSSDVSYVDTLYYSGVVFFTVGFGEIVPEAIVPRLGAIVEAFLGVLTTALVIGYLPSLYSAYSDRERALMTLDDGSGERITPTNLVKAWSPDADPKKLEARFAEWERWAAGVLETQSTLPLLMFFRSHEQRQHWVTALGLLTDAALHAQMILGAYDGNGYWFLRRATAVFDELTRGVPERDLDPYVEAHDAATSEDGPGELFAALYRELEEHGFDLVPPEMALAHARHIRRQWAPKMEYAIDFLLAPRGFWCPEQVDIQLLSSQHPEVLHVRPGSRLLSDVGEEQSREG